MTGTSLYLYLLVLMLCGSQQILGESNNGEFEEEQGKLTHIYLSTYKCIFILQSVHLLYKYAIRINFCFIRTRRINFSACE